MTATSKRRLAIEPLEERRLLSTTPIGFNDFESPTVVHIWNVDLGLPGGLFPNLREHLRQNGVDQTNINRHFAKIPASEFPPTDPLTLGDAVGRSFDARTSGAIATVSFGFHPPVFQVGATVLFETGPLELNPMDITMTASSDDTAIGQVSSDPLRVFHPVLQPDRQFLGLESSSPITAVTFSASLSQHTPGHDVSLLVDYLTFAAVTSVEIDIKPGSDSNPINLNSSGVLPVAILTTDDFDASTVDTPDLSQLAFGDMDLAARVSPIRDNLEDVDGDGDTDLILHFSMRDIRGAGALVSTSTEAELTGVTHSGTAFRGTDTVAVFSPPRGHGDAASTGWRLGESADDELLTDWDASIDLLVGQDEPGAFSVLRFDGLTGAPLGDFIPAGSGGLAGPEFAIMGKDGKLYVSSNDNHQVLRFDGKTGTFLDVFVTAGSGGLARPDGLAFGPDGNLYVAGQLSDAVLRYDGTTGVFMDVFASGGGLDRPTGITFGPDGNLYVSSYETDGVLRFDGNSGSFIDAFVASGSGGLDGPGTPKFRADGMLYVVSQLNDRVLRYDGGTGDFVDVFVAPGAGGIDAPEELVFGPDGNAYVSGLLSNNVVRYDGSSGAFIDVFADAVVRPTFLIFRATVPVDIKPGSLTNPINLRARGRLPVALLTVDNFDAASVDLSDLSQIILGDPNVAERVSPQRGVLEDVDGDGNIDLVLHFSMRDIADTGALVGTSTQAELTGFTVDGTFFHGTDAVRIVGAPAALSAGQVALPFDEGHTNATGGVESTFERVRATEPLSVSATADEVHTRQPARTIDGWESRSDGPGACVGDPIDESSCTTWPWLSLVHPDLSEKHWFTQVVLLL